MKASVHRTTVSQVSGSPHESHLVMSQKVANMTFRSSVCNRMLGAICLSRRRRERLALIAERELTSAQRDAASISIR